MNNVHSKNRKEIMDFLRADMLGPSNLSKFIKFQNLDTDVDEIIFESEEESRNCFLDFKTQEEIIQTIPSRTYCIGILYPQGIEVTEDDELTEEDLKEIDISNFEDFITEEETIENKKYINDQKKQKRSLNLKDDESQPDIVKLTHARKPSAMGISFRFDLREKTTFEITVSGGVYTSISTFRKWHKKNKNGDLVQFDVEKGKKSKEGYPFFKTFYKRHNLLEKFSYSYTDFDSIADEGFLNDREINFLNNLFIVKTFIRRYEKSFIATVTLLNKSEGKSSNLNSLFQSKLEIRVFEEDQASKILPYPESSDLFDGVLEANEHNSFEFIYNKMSTFAIGHGTSVDWTTEDNGITAKTVCTEFIPEHEIQPLTPDIVELKSGKKYDLSMEKFSKGESLDSIKLLIDDYESWINSLKSRENKIDSKYKEIFKNNIFLCEEALNRMQTGYSFIIENHDSDILEAFKYMNKALYLQQNIPNQIREVIIDPVRPKIGFEKKEDWVISLKNNSFEKGNWRAFQIGFILLVIESMVNKNSNFKNNVDLLWFPTGGGKTEAYLGVTAFTLFYSRLKDSSNDGVQALMRYTLRLLTAQQFERASKLILCMEHIRSKNSEKFGIKEFSIGIWVGKDVTPNTINKAQESYDDLLYHNADPSKYNFLLQACPFCRAQMGPIGYQQAKKNKLFLDKSNTALRILGVKKIEKGIKLHCPDKLCQFNKSLPIYCVDEDIYQNRPSLIISTVDKFANLIWNENARSIFGLNDEGERQTNPPSLIIQDELHLISNALGSAFGFFETLIDELCTYITSSGETLKPKIICSTATIKNSKEQILSLFGRQKMSLFPPAGIDISDSFFAKEDNTKDGKLYTGISFPTFSTQEAQARVLTNFLRSPNFLSEEERDPWWTNLNYFHSIRELGTTWSIYHEDVQRRLKLLSSKFNLFGQKGNFKPFDSEIVELTSRISSTEVVDSMKKMEVSTTSSQRPLRAILATSIVEVGVDVQRLSLLTILGQPKNTSQYIQVAGRVGRSKAAGLVLTIFGAGRPRDISHYEKFKSFHQRLYSAVEPTSVTPFSLPAVERFLDGVFFMYLRMCMPKSVFSIDPNLEKFPNTYAKNLKELFVNKAKLIGSKQHEIEFLSSQFDKLEKRWKKTNARRWSVNNHDLIQPPMTTEQGTFAATHFEESFKVPTSMRSVEQTSRPKIVNDRIIGE